MYDFASAFALACISEYLNSVIREWGRGLWPVMWRKTDNEFCLIILFCHCSCIATNVANITVLFGSVGVRKFAKNLQKFVESWWQSWLLELWHRACRLLGGRDTADSRFTQRVDPSARNTCWTAEEFQVPPLMHFCSFVLSLKSPWAQVRVQMDSFEVVFRAAGFTCYNMCLFLCQRGQGWNKPP